MSNSIGAYDATTRIPMFRGLMQYGDGINGDPSYATEEKNLETIGGVLQPAAACTLLTPTTPDPIETLMRLHRRWHSGDDKDILVAAAGGKLYSMLPTDQAWTELPLPEGLIRFWKSTWSWVTYEINPPAAEYEEKEYAVGDYCFHDLLLYVCIEAIETPEEWNDEHWRRTESGSVDVLLISNDTDGMYMIRGDVLTVSFVPTPKKFGVIERYAERIWGGAILNDPDMLVYSAPFDPTDWRARGPNPDPSDPWAAEGEPEDGAGDINQPSWDGDSFTALRSFGSQLIAFKKNRVWRILGTDPGEYTFKEQYGGGTPYENTIAVDTERILMLSDRGVVVYDGLAVSPFQQQYAEKVWKRLNREALEQSTAILWHHKYYCAVPLDGSTSNNAVMIYDTVDNTWLLREDVNVEAFLGTDDDLYFTDPNTPGQVWLWKENSWENTPTSAATRWVTPWNDLSNKTILVGGFEVYLLAEVKDAPVTLNLSIQTEKKIKTKQYTVNPLTAAEKANNKSHKQKKVHFGGTGRRFRLIIETPANSPSWRMISGVEIVSEIDPD